MRFFFVSNSSGALPPKEASAAMQNLAFGLLLLLGIAAEGKGITNAVEHNMMSDHMESELYSGSVPFDQSTLAAG